MPRLLQLALVAPLALAACSLPAGDSPSTSSALTTVALTDGAEVTGQLIGIDSDALTLQIEGEETARRISRGEVDSTSWHRALGSADLDSTTRFVVFRSALADGDYVAAEIEAARIVEQDPARSAEVIAAFDGARDLAAGDLVTRARAALVSGDRASAEKHAARVLSEFGETDAAGEARSLIADLVVDEPAEDTTNLELASVKQSDKRIKDAQRYTARGARRGLKGLTESGSTARKAFDSATADYTKAISALDKVTEDDEASADQQLLAQQLREKAVQDKVQVHLNTARFFMNRGSNNQANEALDQARSLDPENLKTEALTKQVAFLNDEWGRIKNLRKLGGKKWRERPTAE